MYVCVTCVQTCNLMGTLRVMDNNPPWPSKSLTGLGVLVLGNLNPPKTNPTPSRSRLMVSQNLNRVHRVHREQLHTHTLRYICLYTINYIPRNTPVLLKCFEF